MANKYNANTVWFNRAKEQVITEEEAKVSKQNYPKTSRENILRFSSKFEYEVYQALTSWVSKSQVIAQYPVGIIPPCTCYPKGKIWKVDFAITAYRSPKVIALVEAKGMVTREFSSTLAFLELNQPDLFNKLWLVFKDTEVARSRVITRLAENPKTQPRITTLWKLLKNGISLQ